MIKPAIPWAATLFLVALFAKDLHSQPITLAVIGASTAAGKNLVEDGSSLSESWVNRYAAYLNSVRPGSRIVNLAVPGYNTYHGLPTGSTIPSGRPAPDTAKNITAALAANPDAIIANYVGDGGFGTTEAMANLRAMQSAASRAGIPFWVATTQPSISGQTATVLAQKLSQRDSVLSQFGAFAIDFWTPLADPSGSGLGARNLIQLYDDAHPNAEGHRLLFNQVVAAGVGVGSANSIRKFRATHFTQRLLLSGAIPYQWKGSILTLNGCVLFRPTAIPATAGSNPPVP